MNQYDICVWKCGIYWGYIGFFFPHWGLDSPRSSPATRGRWKPPHLAEKLLAILAEVGISGRYNAQESAAQLPVMGDGHWGHAWWKMSRKRPAAPKKMLKRKIAGKIKKNWWSIFRFYLFDSFWGLLYYVWYHEDWTKPPRSVTLRIILWLGLSLRPFESWTHWLQRKKEGPDGQKDSWVVLFTFPLGQADSSVPFHVFHSMCVFWTVMVASHSNWHGAKCF